MDWELKLDQLDDFFGAHGYIRMSEPVKGEEAQYVEFLKAGREAINRMMDHYAKRYHTRGLSKRALGFLHSDLPQPVWGVEIR